MRRLALGLLLALLPAGTALGDRWEVDWNFKPGYTEPQSETDKTSDSESEQATTSKTLLVERILNHTRRQGIALPESLPSRTNTTVFASYLRLRERPNLDRQIDVYSIGVDTKLPIGMLSLVQTGQDTTYAQPFSPPDNQELRRTYLEYGISSGTKLVGGIGMTTGSDKVGSTTLTFTQPFLKANLELTDSFRLGYRRIGGYREVESICCSDWVASAGEYAEIGAAYVAGWGTILVNLFSRSEFLIRTEGGPALVPAGTGFVVEFEINGKSVSVDGRLAPDSGPALDEPTTYMGVHKRFGEHVLAEILLESREDAKWKTLGVHGLFEWGEIGISVWSGTHYYDPYTLISTSSPAQLTLKIDF